jgi:phage shock protein PspC (stress-responsive transcriptional regulator)
LSIELLARPYDGRWIAGVCSAFENAYGVPVWLVRAILVVSFFVAPIVLLLYLLFAISTPSERGVVELLQSRERQKGTIGFANLASLLVRRTHAGNVVNRRRYATIVPLLFLMTLLFGLPKLEGSTFYQLHPVLETVQSSTIRIAGILFYLLIALAFFLHTKSRHIVILQVPSSDTFRSETGPLKAIGGIAAAISRVTLLDVAVIRVILLMLNFLTLGVVGAIYFFFVWRSRRWKSSAETGNTQFLPDDTDRTTTVFAGTLGALFILLAVVRLSTEFRLFFFNEPFIRGILLGIVGVLCAGRLHPLFIVAGAVLFFCGIQDITIALFHVQPSAASRWVIAYSILILAILYYTAIALRGTQLKAALWFAAVPLLAAVLISTHIIPESFILILSQFYDFFSPLIFTGLALWVAMEA